MSKRNFGRPFRKGQSGNPGGRPKLPADLRDVIRSNQIEVQKLLNKIIWKSQEEVEVLSRNKQVTILEQLVSSVLLRGLNEGCHHRLETILNRVIGKAKDLDANSNNEYTMADLVSGSYALEKKMTENNK